MALGWDGARKFSSGRLGGGCYRGFFSREDFSTGERVVGNSTLVRDGTLAGDDTVSSSGDVGDCGIGL